MFVEAVLWIVRTGSTWRDLPEVLGECNTVFRRFSRWSEKGIWWRIFAEMSDDPDFEYLIVDSTIIRAHQHAAGAKKGLKIKPIARLPPTSPIRGFPSKACPRDFQQCRLQSALAVIIVNTFLGGDTRSVRVVLFSFLLLISSFSIIHAETLEGRLVSMDADARVLTLDGGETMRLTELVPMEGLAIGQLLRLEFQDGTADVTSLLVLEEAPPPPADEEPIVEDNPQ